MAKSKASSSPKLDSGKLLTLLLVVVFLVFAVLVGRKIVNLKNRHSGNSGVSGQAQLAPPTNLTNQ